MIKIWGKLYKEDKIVKNYVFCLDENMDYSRFFEFTSEIASNLDIPTPVVIKTHIFNYAKYNYVKFTKDDFVEEFPFDKFILENIANKT